ncbi:hypothetical protein ACM66B_000938 [Microbotryomycetes sp. NB124-2]
MSYNYTNSPYPPQGSGQSYGQYGAGGQPFGQHGTQHGGAPPPAQFNYQQQQPYQQQQQYQQHYGQQQQQYGQSGYSQQQAGYGAPPPQQQAPSQQQLQQWFTSVDTDRSGHITEQELKQALINGDWTPFEDATIKMLMSLFDADRNGTIGFNEFAGLWTYIKEWQACFRTFDRDRSGTIEGQELSHALSQFGYSLSPRLIDMLQRKYNPVPPKSMPGSINGPRGINFDRFVRCCVAVRQLTDAFRRADHDNDGYVNMGYEQFMDIVLQAP